MRHYRPSPGDILLTLFSFLVTLLILLMTFTSCASQRRTTDVTDITHRDTQRLVVVDTMRITTAATWLDATHLVTLTETIRTTWLDTLGRPTRIEETIRAAADEQRDTRHTLHTDSTRQSRIEAESVHQRDTTILHDDTTSGNASLSPTQTLIRRLTSLDVILPIAAFLFLYVYLKWIAPKFLREE